MKMSSWICLLLLLAPAALAQRLEEGRVRPAIDGEVVPLHIVIRPQINDPASARRSIDGLPTAITFRVLMKIEGRTPATGFAVKLKDKSDNPVAEYGATDFLKGELWSAPVPGATATVEVEWPGEIPAGLSLAILAGVSQQKPGDPMLSIIGDFDLETMESLRNEKPEIFKAGLAVAKLSFIRNNKSYVCTGFMIDDERMLTNEHCIDTQAVCDTAVAIFDFHSDASITADVLRDRTTRCAEFLTEDKVLDVALIRLRDSPGSRWGKLKLSGSATSTKELAVIIQHPNGEIKQISRKDCFVAKYPADGRDKDTDFGHRCDTMGGSSGSPVLDRKNLEVIGLHHFGVDPKDATWRNLNRAVRIELIRSKLKI
jgi:V8-like Glu-specific endopeptidase